MSLIQNKKMNKLFMFVVSNTFNFYSSQTHTMTCGMYIALCCHLLTSVVKGMALVITVAPL